MFAGPAQPQASNDAHGFFGLAQLAGGVELGAELVGAALVDGALLLVGAALVLVGAVLLGTGLLVGAALLVGGWLVGVAVGV